MSRATIFILILAAATGCNRAELLEAKTHLTYADTGVRQVERALAAMPEDTPKRAEAAEGAVLAKTGVAGANTAVDAALDKTEVARPIQQLLAAGSSVAAGLPAPWGTALSGLLGIATVVTGAFGVNEARKRVSLRNAAADKLAKGQTKGRSIDVLKREGVL